MRRRGTKRNATSRRGAPRRRTECRGANGVPNEIGDGALLALGDQPTLRAEVVSAVIAAAAAGKIVVPTFEGRRGHPVLIPSLCFGQVLSRFDAVGLRGLLAERPERVVEVPVTDAWVLHDIDDPESYRAATAPT